MEEGGAQDGRRGKRSVGGPSGFEAEGIGKALYEPHVEETRTALASSYIV